MRGRPFDRRTEALAAAEEEGYQEREHLLLPGGLDGG
jgi:hypothetical protein